MFLNCLDLIFNICPHLAQLVERSAVEICRLVKKTCMNTNQLKPKGSRFESGNGDLFNIQ